MKGVTAGTDRLTVHERCQLTQIVSQSAVDGAQQSI